MSEKNQNIPQGVTPAGPVNLSTDSDQVKALVVGGGPTDSGGGLSNILLTVPKQTGTGHEIRRSDSVNSLTSVASAASAYGDEIKETMIGWLRDHASLRSKLQDVRESVRNMTKTLTKQKNVNVQIKDGLPMVASALIEAVTLLDRMEETAKKQPLQPGRNDQGSSKTLPKRKRARVSSDGGGDTPTKKDKREINAPSTSTEKEEDSARPQPPWELAASRKAKKKEKKRQGQSHSRQESKKEAKAPRRKRDAILIKPEAGKTYAEILGQIKAKVKPDELNTEVKFVRKTRDGGVLVVVGKSDDEMKALQEAIQSAVGQTGTVKGKVSRTILEIRDIDGLTTTEEVANAIRKETSCTEEEAKVRLFDPNAREQRVALVEMDQTRAAALLKKGKIRIGWVNCRVRVRANVMRCYRCLGYGHQKGKCGGLDRSANCWKCGMGGHKAAACNVPAQQLKCFLCAEAKIPHDKLAHAPGTGGCAVFRAALNASRTQR